MMKWYRILSLIGFIFVLNILWEISTSFLYVYAPDFSFSQHVLMSSLASLGLIITFLLAVSLGHRNLKWIDKPSAMDYLAIIAAGMLTSWKIEMYALDAGSWFYTPLMPTIFGLGLVPLIQLFIITIISLIIIRKLNPSLLQ